MRTFVRRMLWGIVVVVVLAACGVLAAVLLADRALKAAVERAGTRALNVNVTVGKAHVSLWRGSAELQDVRVANPPGFPGPALLILHQAHIDVNTAGLWTDILHLDRITLDHVDVFVEQQGLRNNLYEVIRPLRESREPTGRRLTVDTLEVASTTVRVALAPLPGRTQTKHVTLGPLRLTDLGRQEKMDTAALMVKTVLAVAAAVAQQAGDILPKDTLGEITSLLNKTFDLGRLLPGRKATDPNQPGSPGDLGQTITEGLQDLRDGRKKP